MAKGKILVVDDEIGIRELLSEILRDEGYQVRLAENAGQARTLRGQGRPAMTWTSCPRAAISRLTW